MIRESGRADPWQATLSSQRAKERADEQAEYLSLGGG
jgi:hypothetical protein